MKLTSEKIKHVATLANLDLTDDELVLYGEQLSNILGYIDQLERVDTKEVLATFDVSPNKNMMAKDEVTESLTQQEALQNAPQTKNGYIVTKGVFEEG